MEISVCHFGREVSTCKLSCNKQLARLFLPSIWPSLSLVCLVLHLANAILTRLPCRQSASLTACPANTLNFNFNLFSMRHSVATPLASILLGTTWRMRYNRTPYKQIHMCIGMYLWHSRPVCIFNATILPTAATQTTAGDTFALKIETTLQANTAGGIIWNGFWTCFWLAHECPCWAKNNMLSCSPSSILCDFRNWFAKCLRLN